MHFKSWVSKLVRSRDSADLQSVHKELEKWMESKLDTSYLIPKVPKVLQSLNALHIFEI